MAALNILGAVYGLLDVTAFTQSQVLSNALTISASDTTFGSSTWSGVTKSLVIVYQYDGFQPQVATTQQNSSVTINNNTPGAAYIPPTYGTLTVLGAAYGTTNVTTIVNNLVGTTNYLNTPVNSTIFGTGIANSMNTLVVVYQYYANPHVVFNLEGNGMMICPDLSILGASYGPALVTDNLWTLVNKYQTLNFTPNIVFKDTWPGVEKSFALIYQYGEETPQVVTSTESQNVAISYSQNPISTSAMDPNQLTILGAVYGLSNVTTTIDTLVSNNRAGFVVNDHTLGDGWPGREKTFLIVYQYGRENDLISQVVIQNNDVLIQKTMSNNKHFISADGILANGESFALLAANQAFVAPDVNHKLFATAATAASSSFTVHEASDDLFRFSVGTSYLTINFAENNAIYANGTRDTAAVFHVGLSRMGSLYLYSVDAGGNQLILQLNDEDNSIEMTATNTYSLLSSFDLYIETGLSSQVITQKYELETIPSLSACQIAQASMAWQLTGGFFLAIGLGPYISSGTSRTGVVGIINSNQAAAQAFTALTNQIFSARGVAGMAVVIFFGKLYDEGLMWSIAKFIAKSAGWIGLTKLIAKILEFVLLPEEEAIEILASFAVWSAQTVVLAVEMDNACK